MRTFDVFGLPNTNAPVVSIGKAYVYVSFAKRLYITLTFACNQLFSTDPTFTNRAVEVGLWSSIGAPTQ